MQAVPITGLSFTSIIREDIGRKRQVAMKGFMLERPRICSDGLGVGTAGNRPRPCVGAYSAERGPLEPRGGIRPGDGGSNLHAGDTRQGE